MSERRYSIRVCRGPECGDRRGSRAVYDRFRSALEAADLARVCELGWQSCFGRCTQGPNVLVREITTGGDIADPGAVAPQRATALYNGVQPVAVDEVVQQHVGRGLVVGRLIQQASLIGTTPLRSGSDPS